MKGNPLLSIITVNYNDANGLQKTIESVLTQTYPFIEFIIIDGGSNDDSLDVIRKYSTKINKWVHEKDNGIYHAMNKGILMATGEYLLFLNSGDYLVNNEILSSVFFNNHTEDIFFGDIYLLYENGIKKCQSFPEKVTLELLSRWGLPHQAMFIKKELFKIYGLYKEEYKFISDWEYCTRLILKFNVSYKHINIPISIVNTYGTSYNPKFQEIGKQERYMAQIGIFPSSVWETAEELTKMNNLYSEWMNNIIVRNIIKIFTVLKKIKKKINAIN